MAVQSSEWTNSEHLVTAPRRHFLIEMLLLSLNAFVLGGWIVLLVVNRLLNNQFNVYVTAQNMRDSSTVLDLIDDFMPLYFIYGGALLILVLITASVWTWIKTQSRLLRYGVILLCSIVLIILGGMWFSRI